MVTKPRVFGGEEAKGMVQMSGNTRQVSDIGGIPARFRANIADRLYYCMRRLNSGYYHVVLSLDGQIDEGRFAKSVRLAADAEPLLGSRFVDDWFRPYWERRHDLENVQFFRLLEPADVQAELDRIMAETCDPRFDPQFTVFLLRGKTDTICLRLNHMIGDGGGAKGLVYLLACIYCRLCRDPDYRPKPNLSGDRSFREIGQQLKLRDKLAIARRRRWPIRELRKVGAGWQLPIPKAGLERSNIWTLTLPPERGKAIRSYALSHQASVNFVLLTAFFRALEAVVHHPSNVPLPVIMTVDLRRYLPSKKTDAISNLSGVEILFARSSPVTQFNEIMTQFHQQFEALKSQYVGFSSISLIPLVLETFPLINIVSAFIPFRLIKGAVNLAMKQSVTTGVVAMSNVGEVDPERSRFGDVEVRSAYVTTTLHRIPGMLKLAVTYFRDAITIAVYFMENCLSLGTVQDVLDRMDRELPQ